MGQGSSISNENSEREISHATASISVGANSLTDTQCESHLIKDTGLESWPI